MPSEQENPPPLPSQQSASTRPSSSRLANIRVGMNDMFTGRSRAGHARKTRNTRHGRRNSTSSNAMESPKTPHFVLGLGNFSSTRLAIPHLNRTAPSTPTPSSPIDAEPRAGLISPRPITPNALRQQLQQPTVSSVPSHVRHNSARRFAGGDPATLHLAGASESRSRRQYKKPKKSSRSYCGLRSTIKKVRRKALSCLISGLFLALVLIIYLALALTNRNESQEFHVILILIILVTTIFFCHSLIRLCMMMVHTSSEDTDIERQNLPAMSGLGGYANPSVPIRVALVRDEEAAGIEDPATKFPPPAYGIWRESVRVDPNRIFWQRNEAAMQRSNSRHTRPSSATRPPSYISEDGIEYVVEASARPFTHSADVPLPPHPSERGRALLI